MTLTRASSVLLFAVSLLILLASAQNDENTFKRSPLGTMRFGKRSPFYAGGTMQDGMESMLAEKYGPRETRSGNMLGTMRFGKRAYPLEDLDGELSFFSQKRNPLGTMRFGR